MGTKKLELLFNIPARKPESELLQAHKDIAAALQKITEEAVLAIAQHAKEITKSKNICLAGGVALNCVANGMLANNKVFENIYIQPAAGDAGSAVGAALYVYYGVLGHERKSLSAMPNVYMGPSYSDESIISALENKKLQFATYSYDTLLLKAAELIDGTNAVSWFQGRMEFGPRALGNRSILADPRNKENWQKINLKVKYRESFRPFAPAVIDTDVSDYFALTSSSPYMLLVDNVVATNIPAVTHVDNSARIQTVSGQTNKRFYDLLQAFKKRTGCSVLINTSFNVRGEPIVMTPEDAINSFINTEIDYLIMNNVIVPRVENQEIITELRDNETYLQTFSLD